MYLSNNFTGGQCRPAVIGRLLTIHSFWQRCGILKTVIILENGSRISSDDKKQTLSGISPSQTLPNVRFGIRIQKFFRINKIRPPWRPDSQGRTLRICCILYWLQSSLLLLLILTCCYTVSRPMYCIASWLSLFLLLLYFLFFSLTLFSTIMASKDDPFHCRWCRIYAYSFVLPYNSVRLEMNASTNSFVACLFLQCFDTVDWVTVYKYFYWFDL